MSALDIPFQVGSAASNVGSGPLSGFKSFSSALGARMTQGNATSLPPVNTSSDSAAMHSSPVGNTYRGLFGDMFNSENIAREDWMRSEQSADNAAHRNERLQKQAQEHSDKAAREADERSRALTRDQYSLMVEGMKKAGINPILALGAMDTASSPMASSPSNNAGRGQNSRGGSFNTAGFLGDLLRFASGLVGIGVNASNVASMNTARLNAAVLSRKR